MAETCIECPAGDPRPVKSRRLCKMHYVRHWRAGTLPPKAPAVLKHCTELDGGGQPCQGRYKAKGLCDLHYLRKYRGARAEPQRGLLPEERFFFYVSTEPCPCGCDCCLWEGGTQGQGYGTFSVKNERFLVHRYIYELCIGPIPPSYQVDHVRKNGCRHRHCVKLTHLEPVTLEENVRRAQIGARAQNGDKLRAFHLGRRVARFWEKADRLGGPDAHWPWLAYVDKKGCAKAWWDGSTHNAREIAWRLINGDFLEGQLPQQTCGRSDCVNPVHMKLVGRPEAQVRRAAAARAAKNRGVSSDAQNGVNTVPERSGRDYGAATRGELNAGAKLTAGIVAACRTRFRAGEAQNLLAAEFDVTTAAMSNAIRGKTWAGPQRGVLPVPRELRPSQGTSAFREQMARKGQRGVAARWHPGVLAGREGTGSCRTGRGPQLPSG